MLRATLRTYQALRGIEIADRPHVPAREMVDQPVIGKTGRAALAASLTECGDTLTLRAELNPIENRPLQDTEILQGFDQLRGAIEPKLHSIRLKDRGDLAGVENLLYLSTKFAADMNTPFI